MADVARLAGVSQQMVSRVVNGKTNVTPEVRERVERAIGQLRYHPNVAARALAGNRAMNIGVVALGVPLYANTAMLYGITEENWTHGYGTSVITVDRVSGPRLREAVQHHLAAGVAGIVLLTSLAAADEAIGDLTPTVPVVLFGPGGDDRAGVISLDDATGAALATRHLLELGHETVWYIAGRSDWTADGGRREGWENELRRAGRTVPPVLPSDWTAASGYAAGERIAADPAITAVFASNDDVALGACKALADRGVRVPEDVSIVGFNDVPFAEYFRPGLTTVRLDFFEVGRACAREVVANIAGDRRADPALPPHTLVVRASTAPPAARRSAS
ncbi:LacI family DNA-binding transcriptional regulator [Planctomonas deserti]|uniref:LacI family DNA-binding transcriptional regulator n=1 Tax=Planctomonas deserti TaxID=2144185 RepID=UPI000D37A8A9|nr:LacI family DNA-binding transcriptional regulator [Planctomonas deserti]